VAVLNFGSLNIDHVYEVPHFVEPGETLDSHSYTRHCGGKGLNQSVALARAGAEVFHAGKVGAEGGFLIRYLRDAGVDVHNITLSETPTGHALIQVDSTGENAIILYGGANREIAADDADRVVQRCSGSDVLLLQNEISSTAEIILKAADRGMEVFFNPAPMTEKVFTYPLDTVRWFIVNEIEGAMLSGAERPEDIPAFLLRKYPHARVVLTLGSRGAVYADTEETLEVPAYRVKAVDTTAAGDTFIGYFIASLTGGGDVKAALEEACKAAALCVTRPGAAGSIPDREAVMGFDPGGEG